MMLWGVLLRQGERDGVVAKGRDGAVATGRKWNGTWGTVFVFLNVMDSAGNDQQMMRGITGAYLCVGGGHGSGGAGLHQQFICGEFSGSWWKPSFITLIFPAKGRKKALVESKVGRGGVGRVKEREKDCKKSGESDYQDMTAGQS